MKYSGVYRQVQQTNQVKKNEPKKNGGFQKGSNLNNVQNKEEKKKQSNPS